MNISRSLVIIVLCVLTLATYLSSPCRAQFDGLGYKFTPKLPNSKWRVHDRNRPQPTKAVPGKGVDKRPDDAIVLFDGKDFSHWQKAYADEDEDASVDPKLIENGTFDILKTGWIKTKRDFRDFQLHIEWKTPAKPDGRNTDWGNSGVFHHGQYELQILESFDNKVYADGMAGAIYGQTPPLVNPARRPGEWQSYDVTFTAPRFDGEKLLKTAYITVLWNGVLVQDHTEIMGSTRHLTYPNYRYFSETGPIVLQPHRSAVRFRNIWIRPLNSEAGEKKQPAQQEIKPTTHKTALPIGIYVKKKSHFDRIEFLPDGKCYYNVYHGSAGTYRLENNAIVCRYGDEVQHGFRWEGKTLVDREGNEWAPREELLHMPWKNVSPLTLVVLDAATEKPVADYAYTYNLSTANEDYSPLYVRPVEVHSKDGSFKLMAPESCEINICIEGGSIIGGFGSWKSYDLTSDNLLRRIEVRVRTGSTITGVVVDAKTGKSIEGASVAPIVFCPPLFTPDRDRAVKTDADGKFTIRGVDYDMGVGVWHPDYLEFGHGGFQKTGEKTGEKSYRARIELERGETLFGTVKDPAGKPLADVEVSDGAGKEVRTKKDGSFVLNSPRKWGGSNRDTYDLSFEKEGYLDKDLNPKEADPKGFAVVLEPLPMLNGQVLDPNGRPIRKFVVSAGVTLEPQPWSCTTETIDNPEGRFSLPVRTDRDYGKSGKVWIGVKAPGHALWETTVDIWQGAKSIVARPTPGFVVKGSVDAPKSNAEHISAILISCCRHRESYTSETSQRQELLRTETSPDAKGAFRFEHVATGQYILAIHGPKISPKSTIVAVADSDIDLDSFPTRGRGSVEGVVYRADRICEGDTCRLDEKRGLWAFAEGTIRFTDDAGRSNENELPHLKEIPFKADEKGRFRVDGVPVGLVSLSIPYFITADIIGGHSRTARIVEGKTTEVRFFDTSGDWDVVCKFTIGDGSPAQYASGTGLGAKRKVDNVNTRSPMFNVALRPTDNAPTSFTASDWNELDDQRQILLRDVHPGRYRLRVRDWQISRGFGGVLHQRDVEIKAGETTLDITLGAGCITGATQWSKENRYMIHVIAAGKTSGDVRHARCDNAGNFCLRYLVKDNYAIYAHDYDAGWCKLPETAVENNIVDVGQHKLAAGGTIKGVVPHRYQTDLTVSLSATDQHGISIVNPNYHKPIGKEYSISNLWPGKWTIAVKKGDESIVEKTVVLQGTETATCDLPDAPSRQSTTKQQPR